MKAEGNSRLSNARGWPWWPAALVALALAAAAAVTARIPVAVTMGLLAVIDVAVLVYWFRRRRSLAAQGIPATVVPMRRLAEALTVAGALLLVNAGWMLMLGALTQGGVTDEATLRWSDVAAAGLRIRADQPVMFGARLLVVALAVWVMGFGLGRLLGERA